MRHTYRFFLPFLTNLSIVRVTRHETDLFKPHARFFASMRASGAARDVTVTRRESLINIRIDTNASETRRVSRNVAFVSARSRRELHYCRIAHYATLVTNTINGPRGAGDNGGIGPCVYGESKRASGHYSRECVENFVTASAGGVLSSYDVASRLKKPTTGGSPGRGKASDKIAYGRG